MIGAGDRILIDAWLAWLEAGNLSPKTVRLRRYLIAQFARGRDLADITDDDVQDYIAGLTTGAWSKAGHLATLHGFFRWATLSGRLSHDPTLLVHAIRVPVGVPKPVPEDVLSRALVSATDQARFMLLLGAYAGLRRSEIAGLHSASVERERLVIKGKGGRTRIIPIHPRLTPYLGFDGWAFPAKDPRRHLHPETVHRRITDTLGGGWTAHSLRHRAATQWYRQSRDIRAVQALLGHSSPATTARYVQADHDALTATVLAVA